jgi:hypothetical protein
MPTRKAPRPAAAAAAHAPRAMVVSTGQPKNRRQAISDKFVIQALSVYAERVACVASVSGPCRPNRLISHACVDVCDFVQMRGQQ